MTFTINYYINHDIHHGFPRISFNSPQKKKRRAQHPSISAVQRSASSHAAVAKVARARFASPTVAPVAPRKEERHRGHLGSVENVAILEGLMWILDDFTEKNGDLRIVWILGIM